MEELRVLIVADRLRPALRDTLQHSGAVAVTAGSQVEAIGRLRRQRFEAVVIDRDGADVDALELVLNVRDFDTTIPIVVVDSTTSGANVALLEGQPQTTVVGPRQVKRLSEELATLGAF